MGRRVEGIVGKRAMPDLSKTIDVKKIWFLFVFEWFENPFFNELEVEDPAKFRMLLKMDVQHFDTLLENITPLIQREDTVMREAIPAKT